MRQLAELQHKIGYQFQNEALLKLALTHRSAEPIHNERLEFIGDSIVNLIVGEALFHAHLGEPEGELSRWRAALVQRETLADLATVLDLQKFIIVGPGEKKMGGHERPSTLSNTLEAIFGALYFDSGFEKTKEIILNLYADRLSVNHIQNIQKDPKTVLQEWLQARQYPLPTYVVIATHGQDHDTLFQISCELSPLSLRAVGEGSSKRKAEQDAAKNMLLLLK